MSEDSAARYWCYMCSQMVNPVMEVEIKCPFCESGFVEEVDGRREDDVDLGSDRAFSLWAPILLGLMGGPTQHRRFRRGEEGEDNQGESEQEREQREGWDPTAVIRRRRRNSAAAMRRLLQSLRSSELDNSESERGDRERVILINPFNQAVILEGSFDSSETQNQSRNTPGSLGDYVIGPGLDLLLQHLADNDPSRYGTPPAKKEAIEAMPTVKISETLECAVCLDDFNIGSEAKEMPCKHKFHSGCIMPWLELHSSCPVCRFQLPSDGSKVDSDVNGTDNSSTNAVESSSSSSSSEERGSDGGDGNGRRFWVSAPWPFSGLFSSSGSQGGGNPSSSSSGSDFPSDEN